MHEIMAQRKDREAHDVAERWQRTAAMCQYHLPIHVLLVSAPVERLKTLRLDRCIAIIEWPGKFACPAEEAYEGMVHVLLGSHFFGKVIPITSEFVPDSCVILRHQRLPSVSSSLPILSGVW